MIVLTVRDADVTADNIDVQRYILLLKRLYLCTTKTTNHYDYE